MARNLKLEVLLAAVDRATTPLKKIREGSGGAAAAIKASRDELRKLQDTQKDLSSFKKLSQASGETATKITEARARVKELHQQLKNTKNPTNELRNSFLKARAATEKLEQAHVGQRRQLSSLRNALKEAGISTHTLSGEKSKLADIEKRLATNIDTTNARLDAQKEKLKQVAAQQRRLDKARAAYDKTRSLAGSMAGTGAAGLATGGAALYGGARFLGPGIEFDATMSRVQALTRLDKNSPQLAAMREQARQLGAETMFSATDAASGMAFLAMAGFTPDSIRAAMPGLLDMAKAGDIDLARTADISSNILSSFGLDPAEMSKVADILTKTFTTSNVNLEMLGNTMQYLGPVAKASGMNLEEAAAMAGLLGNVGIQAEKSGTTLRAMLLRLSAPTGTAAKAMEELGLKATDSEGNIRNIIEVISDVAKATEKMGSGDRLKYLKTIFGEEPAAGMVELLNQAGSGGILKYLDIVNDHQGAAAATAKVMADNLTGDLDELSSAWDDVRIQIFEGEDGALRQLTRDVTELVGKFGAWIKANPELASTIVRAAAAVAALVAAGGALMLMLGSILGPLAMLKYGLSVLGIKSLPLVGMALRAIFGLLLGNPIGLLITAIAGGALLIWRNWETLEPYFTALWEGIKALFLAGLDLLKQVFSWTPLGMLIENWDTLGSYFSSLLETIKTIFNAGWELLKAVFSWSPLGMLVENWGPISSWFSNLATSVVELFKAGFSGLLDILLAPIRAVKGVWGALFGSDDTSAKLDEAVSAAKKASGAIAIGATVAAAPVAADVPIDTRPPITAPSSGANGTAIGSVQISVHATPGMNEAQLARMVAAEIERLGRENAARQRSALYDTE